MKLTNPVGRNVSLNADNDINPRACMCRNGFALSSVLGDSDNCSHASPQTWVLAMKNPRILRGLRRFYRNDQDH